MSPDISKAISEGDLDEKIDFQRVHVFKFTTQIILSFGIERLTQFFVIELRSGKDPEKENCENNEQQICLKVL